MFTHACYYNYVMCRNWCGRMSCDLSLVMYPIARCWATRSLPSRQFTAPGKRFSTPMLPVDLHLENNEGDYGTLLVVINSY